MPTHCLDIPIDVHASAPLRPSDSGRNAQACRTVPLRPGPRVFQIIGNERVDHAAPIVRVPSTHTAFSAWPRQPGRSLFHFQFQIQPTSINNRIDFGINKDI
jgi:hypothetical protein